MEKLSWEKDRRRPPPEKLPEYTVDFPAPVVEEVAEDYEAFAPAVEGDLERI